MRPLRFFDRLGTQLQPSRFKLLAQSVGAWLQKLDIPAHYPAQHSPPSHFLRLRQFLRYRHILLPDIHYIESGCAAVTNIRHILAAHHCNAAWRHSLPQAQVRL